jgi:hypothetical protein
MTALPPNPNWEQLPGTDAGAYYRLQPGVIVAIPKPGFQQSPQSARASLEALDRIAQVAGRKQSVIVLVDHVASQDAAARRVWSSPRPNETRCAHALVCSTLLARAIGSFFLGLNKAAIPTRMFADFESAQIWALQMAKECSGAL